MIRNLDKTYRLARRHLFRAAPEITAVRHISLSIAAGTTVGLIGESGSGKTTLARILLKLERPSAGEVRIDGRELFAQTAREERAYRRTVQAVLQDPYGALSQRMRVDRIVAEPLLAQGGIDRAEALDRAVELLEIVGLEAEAATRYPHQFSGGQRQRIAIARALSVGPRLLVLDEPVAALDVSVRAQILTLLREVQSRLGTTYLLIGHDLAVVRFMSDVIGVMYFGRLVEIGKASKIFRNPLHPYTKMLVNVAAGNQALGTTRLTGEPPNPLDPPAGCQFQTRCTFAAENCRAIEPELKQFGSEHEVACHFVENFVDV